jgi:hypothetical protein
MQPFQARTQMLSVRALSTSIAAALAAMLCTAAASAADYRVGAGGVRAPIADLQLACEGGRNYVIRARAVSVAGDLGTGYILSGRRGGHYVRLIPMGDGYRYAGRGIWLDGKGATADLHLGKRRSLSCTVGTLA